MDDFSNVQLVDSLKVAATQSAFLLAAGARRVNMLSSRLQDIEKLKISERELKKQVAILEEKKANFVAHVERVAGEKMIVEEKLAALEAKYDDLCLEKEVLEGQAISLGEVVKARDEQLDEQGKRVAKVSADLEWVLTRGLTGVVDQVLDCPAFTRGIDKIKQVCREALEGKTVGEDGSSSSRVAGLEDVLQAVDDLVMLDYAQILKLGRAGLQDLKEVCSLYDDAHEPDDPLIGATELDAEPAALGKDGSDPGVPESSTVDSPVVPPPAVSDPEIPPTHDPEVPPFLGFASLFLFCF